MRRLVRGLLGFVLRLFFRRIEVAGLQQVPPSGPVIFCPNHPNALIDPVLVLATAPRPVSFLAKAPLFRMPVIGWFARVLESIPVYRRQDGTGDTSRNAEMFAAARGVLERGGGIAIFPEGTSHSAPGLQPLRTGAARIALGAGTREPTRIVPVALTYFAKTTFRSSALVSFGAPIPVEPVPPGPDGEPPPDAVAALTGRIADGLRAVLVGADAHEALALAAAAERLFLPSDSPAGDPAAGLAEAAELRRVLVAGHAELERLAPERLALVRRRIERHEARLDGAGLEPRHLTVRRFTFWGVARYTLRAGVWFAVAGPLALPGIVIHWPAYRLIGILARRVGSGSDDVIATAKMATGMLLFPLTWIGLGVLVGSRLGWPLGVATVAIAPWLGWIGLRFVERFDAVAGATRALLLWMIGGERFLRLQTERRRLREELIALAAEFQLVPASASTGSGSG